MTVATDRLSRRPSAGRLRPRWEGNASDEEVLRDIRRRFGGIGVASQRPSTVVNVDGHYAIRVDLEFNRYVLAANSPRGLGDEPDASGSWLVHIFQTGDNGTDTLLSQAERPWPIDAFDTAVGQLEVDGNAIVADADFGNIHHTGERLPDSNVTSAGGPTPDGSFS